MPDFASGCHFMFDPGRLVGDFLPISILKVLPVFSRNRHAYIVALQLFMKDGSRDVQITIVSGVA